MYDILQLNDMLVPELRDIAQRMGVNGFRRLAKQDLIYKILDTQATSGIKDTEGDDNEKEEVAVAKEQPKKPLKLHSRKKGASLSERTGRPVPAASGAKRRSSKGLLPMAADKPVREIKCGKLSESMCTQRNTKMCAPVGGDSLKSLPLRKAFEFRERKFKPTFSRITAAKRSAIWHQSWAVIKRGELLCFKGGGQHPRLCEGESKGVASGGENTRPPSREASLIGKAARNCERAGFNKPAQRSMKEPLVCGQ